MIGTSIKYGDYAPEAKENFESTITDKAYFVNLDQLKIYNLGVDNYANPCEYGAVLLDSSTTPFPNFSYNKNMGYWSNSISQEDKTFTTPIVLTMTSTGQYSSQGFTITFDTYNNTFCNSLNIKWYRNNTLLSNMNFTPNSPFYFCENQIDNFDKVIMTFNSMNMPYNRLKIFSIDFGYGTIFTGDELSGVKVIQELDRLSTNISINVVDFDLKSSNDFEYSFQKKQPISVYFNDKLIQTCFVETSTRTGKRNWRINTIDYIGLLDTDTFMGDIYTNKNAKELLTSIFTQTNTPYEIDSSFNTSVVSGHIPICTCRNAIKQICFAIGAVVDTSNSENVLIKPLSTTESSLIPLERIMQGQKFTDGSTVTSVEVTCHSFMKNATKTTDLYKASENGTGINILVKFNNPCYNLSITNGTITKSGANYAIITANSGCVLTGYEYEDVKVIKSKNNPIVLASEPQNIVEYKDYTLVTSGNIANVLNLCYNESIKVNRVQLKIKEGKHRVKYNEAKYNEAKYGEWIYDSSVNVGDVITAETEYLGNLTGRIVSERFNLNGGIILKECEMI